MKIFFTQFFQSSITSTLLNRNNFLSAVFSNALCSSSSVTNQVQNPHIITGKVVIFILIFTVNILQFEKLLSTYPNYVFVNSDGLLVQCMVCFASYAEIRFLLSPP